MKHQLIGAALVAPFLSAADVPLRTQVQNNGVTVLCIPYSDWVSQRVNPLPLFDAKGLVVEVKIDGPEPEAVLIRALVETEVGTRKNYYLMAKWTPADPRYPYNLFGIVTDGNPR